MQRLSKVKPIACHRGAAILTALLLMALVATLSTAALWQQARAYDIEASERARVQATWILQGASDWARLILREDGRSGGVDHLGEPWAIALQEAPLSSFLSQEATSSGADSRDGIAADALQGAFLSGEMSDMQGRLNVTNLLMDRQIHEPSLRAFRRLFDHLQLPQAELELLALNLRASQPRSEGSDVKPISTPATSVKIGGASTPLVPQTFDQLGWLGLSPRTLAQLRLYVTVLPERSTLNINTAPLPALLAATPGLDSNQAQALITARARSPFHSLAEAARSIDVSESTLNENQHGVTSRFFEVRARLRWGKLATQERTLLQRDGMVVKPLWKRREAVQGASVQ
jgi:general secretion pathway protein K